MRGTSAAALALPLVLAGFQTAAATLAETMALRSGEVIGAAAGCGVSVARLSAVGRRAISLIRDVTADRADERQARELHERTVARVAANMRQHQAECATAITDFEKAERS